MRGINSQIRWDDLRNKIEENNCGIICLQETKREEFDHTYLRNFSPRRFSNYYYTPSIGSSGGLITIWNGSLFNGIIINQSKFQITTKMTCNLSGNIFYVTMFMDLAIMRTDMNSLTDSSTLILVQWITGSYWVILILSEVQKTETDLVVMPTTCCYLIVLFNHLIW